MPRKTKSDSKPRGRMTAYAYFVQSCREEHKRNRPDENVVFAEFSRKCAGRWKTISDMDKKRFQDMAERDKNRYDLEMETYIPPKGEEGRGKRKRRKKDPNAPKRSLSAFFWFCNDERSKVKGMHPEYGIGDVAKVMGRMWSEIDADTKRKYEVMAERDKGRYEKDMSVYKQRCEVAQPMHDEDDDDEDEESDE